MGHVEGPVLFGEQPFVRVGLRLDWLKAAYDCGSFLSRLLVHLSFVSCCFVSLCSILAPLSTYDTNVNVKTIEIKYKVAIKNKDVL